MARIAFVHDWLTGMRGGEKVLEVMCERFPDAEIFTLVHIPGSVSAVIEARPIHTSFIQRLPFVARAYRHYLPLFPLAISRWNFDRFDLVVSISHCCVKSVQPPAGGRHLCYCLTPMRYGWDQFDAYFGPERIGKLGSGIMRPIMDRMARWDRDTADRPNRYVAISHYVAGRIRRYYNRDANVVYPPVDTAFYSPGRIASSGGSRYALIVSALVPYKRIDLAIDACRTARIPLKVVGEGPDRAALERRAGTDATFLGRIGDDELRDLYRGAALVLLPGEEDFGIAPLEAQACGVPVVALGRGGAAETVIDPTTGVLVAESTSDAFATAITQVLGRTYDAAAVRQHAEAFSRERFGDDIEAVIREEAALVNAVRQRGNGTRA